MFDTNPKDLGELLKQAAEGKLQLPDFQRSYVWADEDVRSLLASVIRGFPVGALLTLEAGSEVNFKPRLIEGVTAPGATPEQLLLDGQQRITSLFGVLYAQTPMKTRLRRNQRKQFDRLYYIDIAHVLADPLNIEEAIIGVGADRTYRDVTAQKTYDLSTAALEYQANAFPLNIMFDSGAVRKWLKEWSRHWDTKGVSVAAMEDGFDDHVLAPLQKYKMPVIKLDKSSTREAICLIFEKVNVGGKKLDAFELVTAIYAGQPQPLNLREDWGGAVGNLGRYKRIVQGPKGNGNISFALYEVRNTDFLQAISLLYSREKRLAHAGPGDPPQVSCKRDALLALPLPEFRKHAEAVEDGFRRAGVFLNEQKILWHKDVPYPAQVVAIASIFAVLGKAAETPEAKRKLALWFWRVAISEDFGSSTETKLGKDFPELITWINGGAEPERLSRLGFDDVRLDSLTSRLSAAYKAINALLLRAGCRDFASGKAADLATFYNEPLDIHHIFPRDWCEKQGSISKMRMNSIINKAPISAESNRSIGGAAPSVYLAKLKAKGTLGTDLDAILTSHLITPETLRGDGFDLFYIQRKEALCKLIEDAIGKPVARSLPEEDEDMMDEHLEAAE